MYANQTVECKVFSDLEEFNKELSSRKELFRHFPSFKVRHLNIRSYNRNFDELLVLLSGIRTRFDCLILTEAWLGHVKNPESLEGYDSFKSNQSINQNDGIVVYIDKRLSAKCYQSNIEDAATCLLLNFEFANIPVELLCIYRSPSKSLLKFNDGLQVLLNQSGTFNKDLRESGSNKPYIIELYSQDSLESGSNNQNPCESRCNNQDSLESWSQDSLESWSRDSLESWSQDSLESGCQDSLESGCQDPHESGCQDPLESWSQDPLESGSQDPLESESCKQDILESAGSLNRDFFESPPKLRLMAGDINCDILKSARNKQERRYLDILRRNGFIQCIDKATRIKSFSGTCVDHFFAKLPENFSANSTILQTSITDHFLICLEINSNTPGDKDSTQNEMDGAQPQDHHFIEVGSMVDNNDSAQNKMNGAQPQDHHIMEVENMFGDNDSAQNKMNGTQPKDHHFIEVGSMVENSDSAQNKMNGAQPKDHHCMAESSPVKAETSTKLKPWITDGLLELVCKRDKESHVDRSSLSDDQLSSGSKLYNQQIKEMIENTKKEYYRGNAEP